MKIVSTAFKDSTARQSPVLLSVLFVIVLTGCAANSASGPVTRVEAAETGEAAIPSSNPLSKIEPGMGTSQVISILGPPSDMEMYQTGKQWIPFYFGKDIIRKRLYYKRAGSVVFGGNGRVVEILYDPNEDGFQ